MKSYYQQSEIRPATDVEIDWVRKIERQAFRKSLLILICAPVVFLVVFFATAVLAHFPNWVIWLGLGLAFIMPALMILNGLGDLVFVRSLSKSLKGGLSVIRFIRRPYEGEDFEKVHVVTDLQSELWKPAPYDFVDVFSEEKFIIPADKSKLRITEKLSFHDLQWLKDNNWFEP